MASSAYYYVTGAAGNQKTLTLSGWFKITDFTDATFFSYHDQVSGSSARSEIYLNASSFLVVGINPSGSSWKELTYPNKLRDPAAWYHLVVAYDTTQAVEADRVKVYLNGNQLTASSGTYPSLNEDTGWNANGYQHTIGRYEVSDNMYFAGCVTHVNFIDGTAYAPTAFGEFDSTSGIWIANSSPSVTYGDEGAFFKFASGALTTDSSGNSNTLTAVGTPTATKDSPDNNFCTMNSIYNFRQAATFENGNNTVVTANNTPTLATMGLQAGKWYWEAQAVTSSSGGSDYIVGLVSMFQTVSNTELGNYNKDWGYVAAGSYRNDNTNTAYGDSYTTGDYIGIAFDLDNMKLYFSKNGVWQNSGDPAAGTNGISMTEDTSSNPVPWMQAYFPAVCGDSNGQNYTWSTNFGNGYFGTTSAGASNADDAGIGIFKYDVPAGFYAICTNNLQSYGG